MRQATSVGAALIITAVTVGQIIVVTVITDAWLHRMSISGVFIASCLLGACVWLATLFRAKVERFGIDADPEALRISPGRTLGDVAWTDIERFVAFPGTKNNVRIAMITTSGARELPVPAIDWRHQTLNAGQAAAISAELNLALAGQFLQREPREQPRRALAVISCLIASAALFAVILAGQLQDATRANEIRARAHSENAEIIDVVSVDRSEVLTVAVAGLDGTRQVDFLEPAQAHRPGDMIIVDVDPSQPGTVWIDDQQTWPPGSRSEATLKPMFLAILMLTGPCLIALAFALRRGRANPVLQTRRREATKSPRASTSFAITDS